MTTLRNNANEHDLSAIPAAACHFAGGDIALGSNGTTAKTAPVKITARSGKPIEHWYWGNVVHDLAGMRLNKPRLPIDYAHNDAEVLGYINHFDTESGDLIASGAIIPFNDGDRASEVLFKMRSGVPYEASIFFGGDGIKVQEVAAGELTPVNGYDFEGPGVIIREWPLRGVAICPYGADANTESAALSKGPSFAAAQWTPSAGDQAMSTDTEAVEAQVDLEAVEAVEQPTVEAEAEAPSEEEAVAIEATATDESENEAARFEVVEADAVRARLTAVEADAAHAMQRADEAEANLATVTTERDASIAELTATTDALNKASAEIEGLRARLAAIEKGAPPVSAQPADEGGALTPWQKAQRAQRP